MAEVAAAPVWPGPASADLVAAIEEEAPALLARAAVRGQASVLLVQAAVEEEALALPVRATVEEGAPALPVRAAVREQASSWAVRWPVAPAWVFPRPAVPVDAVPGRSGEAAEPPESSPASSLVQAVAVPAAWVART